MKKIFLFILPLSLLSNLILSQATVSNQNPLWGETIIVSYTPDEKSKLKQGNQIYLTGTIVHENYNSEVIHTISMKENEGIYKCDFRITEGSSLLKLSFLNQDGNRDSQARLGDIIPLDKNGDHYRNAYSMNVPNSLKELELYPDNFIGYDVRWQFYLPYMQRDSAKIITQQELKNIESTESKKPIYFYIKIVGNSLLGDFKEARNSLEYLMEKHPLHALTSKGIGVYQKYASMREHKTDGHDISSSLQKFYNKYPNTESSLDFLNSAIYNKQNIDKELIRKICTYWMKKTPKDPFVYSLYIKSLDDKEEKSYYLNKAVSALFDNKNRIENNFTWKGYLPLFVPMFMDELNENGDYDAAYTLSETYQKNVKSKTPDFYNSRAKSLEGLNRLMDASQDYLRAMEYGKEGAKTKALDLYLKSGNDRKNFDKYADDFLYQDYFSEVFDKMPDFKIVDLEGNEWSAQNLKGKVVVFNFWFIGCSPCRAEIPALNKLVSSYGNKDVVFLAFAEDSSEKLESFLSEKSFNYNIVSKEFNISDSFGVTAHPTHFIIDKKGNIRSKFTGGSPNINKELKPLINRALKY